ncbi:2-oxo acid dehydrogenase subunit E2 [Streptomyces sp. VRA16 Mangrove soil]|uniref:2-oxo acid dehydrogenase subunit E2 n=1 Tax=Streptomyces sp. VRA16 Mangrove soil TaxID=2817434 RepID=UPI001A9DC122|nr:2-oxo acid dehydrogenase subunit E2 [Streptomyces sp. VRA16 Mangrove soil]MBO1333022.1 2-oxo acid dehydrogenase subunit E2 [Streptomyces sp. VRA16 Mangrove soil]
MAEFTMPSLGADMDEGVLQEWLVAPGAHVTKGDVVAVVETDKSAIEVECFETGTVQRLLVEPGTRVPVGAPLAMIGAGDAGDAGDVGDAAVAVESVVAEGAREPGPAPGPAPEPEPVREPVPAAAPVPEPEPGPVRAPRTRPPRTGVNGPLVRHLAEAKRIDLGRVEGTGPGGRVTRHDVERAAAGTERVRATPYARRLADALHITLSTVTGTGERGAVRAADVRAAVPSAVHEAPREVRPETASEPATRPTPPQAQRAATPGMRAAIAHLMTRSKREIPHYYLSTTVDLSTALAWLRATNRERPVAQRLLPAALLLKATALAARAVPDLNGFWTDDRFVPGDAVHLGFAVSLRGGGLLTPVLHDAAQRELPDLMTELKDTAVRARTGRLRASELTGATLTVTNLGEQGVESVYGVIHPPQVALVGFGAVVERPCAVDGLLGVHPTVTATLSADHRASDGAVGARFLTTLNRLLQHPEEL